MRGTSRTMWAWVLGVIFAGSIGFGAGALQRDAHAQSVATSTIYVPAGGLVFRSADGTAIARLYRGPHGGSFELFDERGEPASAPAQDTGSKGFVLDDDDPWKMRATSSERPGAGF